METNYGTVFTQSLVRTCCLLSRWYPFYEHFAQSV